MSVATMEEEERTTMDAMLDFLASVGDDVGDHLCSPSNRGRKQNRAPVMARGRSRSESLQQKIEQNETHSTSSTDPSSLGETYEERGCQAYSAFLEEQFCANPLNLSKDREAQLRKREIQELKLQNRMLRLRKEYLEESGSGEASYSVDNSIRDLLSKRKEKKQKPTEAVAKRKKSKSKKKSKEAIGETKSGDTSKTTANHESPPLAPTDLPKEDATPSTEVEVPANTLEIETPQDTPEEEVSEHPTIQNIDVVVEANNSNNRSSQKQEDDDNVSVLRHQLEATERINKRLREELKLIKALGEQERSQFVGKGVLDSTVSKNRQLTDELNALKAVIDVQKIQENEANTLRRELGEEKERNKDLSSELQYFKSEAEKQSKENESLQKLVSQLRKHQKAQVEEIVTLVSPETAKSAKQLEIEHELHELKCEIAVERIEKRKFKYELEKLINSGSDKAISTAVENSKQGSWDDMREEALRKDTMKSKALQKEQARLKKKHIDLVQKFENDIQKAVSFYKKREQAFKVEILSLLQEHQIQAEIEKKLQKKKAKSSNRDAESSSNIDASEPSISDGSNSGASEASSSDAYEPNRSSASDPSSSDASEPNKSSASDPSINDASEPNKSSASDPSINDASEPCSTSYPREKPMSENEATTSNNQFEEQSPLPQEASIQEHIVFKPASNNRPYPPTKKEVMASYQDEENSCTKKEEELTPAADEKEQAARVLLDVEQAEQNNQTDDSIKAKESNNLPRHVETFVDGISCDSAGKPFSEGGSDDNSRSTKTDSEQQLPIPQKTSPCEINTIEDAESMTTLDIPSDEERDHEGESEYAESEVAPINSAKDGSAISETGGEISKASSDVRILSEEVVDESSTNLSCDEEDDFKTDLSRKIPTKEDHQLSEPTEPNEIDNQVEFDIHYNGKSQDESESNSRVGEGHEISNIDSPVFIDSTGKTNLNIEPLPEASLEEDKKDNQDSCPVSEDIGPGPTGNEELDEAAAADNAAAIEVSASVKEDNYSKARDISAKNSDTEEFMEALDGSEGSCNEEQAQKLKSLSLADEEAPRPTIKEDAEKPIKSSTDEFEDSFQNSGTSEGSGVNPTTTVVSSETPELELDGHPNVLEKRLRPDVEEEAIIEPATGDLQIETAEEPATSPEATPDSATEIGSAEDFPPSPADEELAGEVAPSVIPGVSTAIILEPTSAAFDGQNDNPETTTTTTEADEDATASDIVAETMVDTVETEKSRPLTSKPEDNNIGISHGKAQVDLELEEKAATIAREKTFEPPIEDNGLKIQDGKIELETANAVTDQKMPDSAVGPQPLQTVPSNIEKDGKKDKSALARRKKDEKEQDEDNGHPLVSWIHWFK